jgi:hypothetical protein
MEFEEVIGVNSYGTCGGRDRSPAHVASIQEIEYILENANIYGTIAAWVRDYLPNPHASLGRAGAVCPYTSGALVRNSVRIAVLRLRPLDRQEQIESAVLHYKYLFQRERAEMGEDARVYAVLMMAFPDVSLDDAPKLIDLTKERLKPQFVREGLMLGEFHQANESPGLHNAKFRPLRSPVPMLVMRQMVASDIAFLDRAGEPAERRAMFLEAYLRQPGLGPAERDRAEAGLRAARAEAGVAVAR